MPRDVAAYEISRAPGADALTARTLFVKLAADLPLGNAYTSVCALTIAGAAHLLAYDKTGGGARFYRLGEAEPWLTAAGQADLTAGWDVVEPFVIGNAPHLLCYRFDTGKFNFVPISTTLQALPPYTFMRTHEPGTSAGFTMVKPFIAGGGLAFMGYNGATGAVALYTLSVTATSPPGTPPLVALAVWSHQWAKGWTRFAFFQLGAENFFLKTNTWKPNVNIDHIVDGLVGGTVEVATAMDLKDAQNISIVESMTFARGDPYFVAYKADGAATLYRFWSDCQGWTEVGVLAAIPAAGHVVRIPFVDRNILIAC